MVKQNQEGSILLDVSLVIVIILLIVALGFGYWAFNSRRDYKNNVDAKINVAVNAAVAQNTTVKNAQFAQKEKDPLTTYNGPANFGSINLQYPKTWSGYVDATGANGISVDGYFAPGVVPSLTDQTSIFALRVQLLNMTYTSTILQLPTTTPGVVVSAYSLPKLPKIVGVEVTGPLLPNKPVETQIILPLRSGTLKIETDGTQYLDDFNKIILPNFIFSP